MNWFFSFFSPKRIPKPVHAPIQIKPPSFPSAQSSEARGLRYDPSLIGKLKKDHEELFVIFDQLNIALKKSDFHRVTVKLYELRIAFTGHILVEEVRFYVYFSRLKGLQEEEKRYVKALRDDMRGITNVLVAFCEKWVSSGITHASSLAFEQELGGVGAALTSRVDLEESTLYTLYVESLD
jgi:regulator of sigma D